MSKCHHPIRVYNLLQLINELISNTDYHMKLNSFKRQRCGVTKRRWENYGRKRILCKFYEMEWAKVESCKATEIWT